MDRHCIVSGFVTSIYRNAEEIENHMRLDQESPVFRNAIVPWYDSETACMLFIFLMFLVFLFASIGISVARLEALYSDFIWVPALLAGLSCLVICSTTIRLIHRYTLFMRTKGDCDS